MNWRWLTMVLVAALALISVAALPALSGEEVRPEVQSFMKSYVEVQNKVDATAIMEMVSKRPGVASITMGEITRGWEGIRAEVDADVGSEGELKMALGTIDVEQLGPNFALAFAPCTVTLAAEQGGLRLQGAVTLVVEKSAGKWKVIHEHVSVQIPKEEGE